MAGWLLRFNGAGWSAAHVALSDIRTIVELPSWALSLSVA